MIYVFESSLCLPCAKLEAGRSIWRLFQSLFHSGWANVQSIETERKLVHSRRNLGTWAAGLVEEWGLGVVGGAERKREDSRRYPGFHLPNGEGDVAIY